MTRSDLSPAQQAVQAVHAALALASSLPVHDLPLALLAAADELELCWLCANAQQDDLLHAAFREPDLGHAVTAVALEPAAARLCRKYPLALREEVKR